MKGGDKRSAIGLGVTPVQERCGDRKRIWSIQAWYSNDIACVTSACDNCNAMLQCIGATTEGCGHRRELILRHLSIKRHARPSEFFGGAAFVPSRGAESFYKPFSLVWRQALFLRGIQQTRRQIVHLGLIRGAMQEDALQNVFQFPYISRPVMP